MSTKPSSTPPRKKIRRLGLGPAQGHLNYEHNKMEVKMNLHVYHHLCVKTSCCFIIAIIFDLNSKLTKYRPIAENHVSCNLFTYRCYHFAIHFQRTFSFTQQSKHTGFRCLVRNYFIYCWGVWTHRMVRNDSCIIGIPLTLLEFHNISNHWPIEDLLNKFFGLTPKLLKVHIVGPWGQDPPVTGIFPSQRANFAESVIINSALIALS